MFNRFKSMFKTFKHREKSQTKRICVVGHGIVAATASIPSKYQTIVTDNSDKRGFGAQAKRFQSDFAMVKFKIWCVFINQSTFQITYYMFMYFRASLKMIVL